MWHVRDKQMSWIVSRDLWSSPVPLIQQKASTFPETQRETVVSSNLLSSQGSLIQQEGYTFQRHNKNFTLLYPSQACLKGSYFLYKECVVVSRSIASPKMLWCPCHARPVPQPLKVHGLIIHGSQGILFVTKWHAIQVERISTRPISTINR